MEQDSLHAVLNKLVGRLDHLAFEATLEPDSASQAWPMIEIYCKLDSHLADLYKNFLEIKKHAQKSAQDMPERDPMSQLLREMKIDAEQAVWMRLQELKDEEEIQEKAARLMRLHAKEEQIKTQEKLLQKNNTPFLDIIAFMIWMGVVWDQKQKQEQRIREAFRTAA
jgi:hypothetical protein